MKLEQGDLFGTDDSESASPTPQKAMEKEELEEKPKPQKPYYPPPKTNFTYADYLKIHCGDKVLASYYYNRDLKRFKSG